MWRAKQQRRTWRGVHLLAGPRSSVPTGLERPIVPARNRGSLATACVLVRIARCGRPVRAGMMLVQAASRQPEALCHDKSWTAPLEPGEKHPAACADETDANRPFFMHAVEQIYTAGLTAPSFLTRSAVDRPCRLEAG